MEQRAAPIPDHGQWERFRRFSDLHRAGIFVMPNPWDAGSARLLEALGFPALATTSAGLAWSLGKRDSCAELTRDDAIGGAARIVAATALPVSADLEDGFGADPSACADTIRQAIAAGLAGGSIEDATGDALRPIHDLSQAVDRIAAAVEARRDQPFVLTARAENFLWARPDLSDTIRRLQAYAEAGADVLFAPGLPDLDAIRTVCEAVDRPVNVVIGLGTARFTVNELAEAGVRRVSLGGSLARAALGALFRAATEVREHGSCGYADAALPATRIEDLLTADHPSRCSSR
jgi:2-methylisocitrate lyase-like PEP mutase family enzyme